MNDLISRQAAIDALNEYFARIGKLKRRGLTKGEKAISLDTVGAIKTLPPIQPEIIYCKDCKHFIREDVEEYTPYGYDTHFHAFCDKHWDEEQGEYIDVNLDDYCSFAERREVTT